MKGITFLVFCLLIAGFSQAQQKAVTETGDEVILFDDGTWQYQDEETQKEKEIPTNPTEFKKDKKSTFLLKSNRFNVGIYLNPKVWSFKKASDNPDAEYQFQLKPKLSGLNAVKKRFT